MLDDAIEILTKLLIKTDLNDRKTNHKEMVTMTKVELYQFCIKLLKEIQKYEEVCDGNNDDNLDNI